MTDIHSHNVPRGTIPIADAADHRPQQITGLPRPVRGVLFDGCNVLYDNTVWRRWVLQVLARLGLHTTYRSFFRLWDRDYLPDVHRGQQTFCDAFGSLLRSAGLSLGQIDEVKAACHARRRDLQANARPLPGVKSTLTRLSQAGFLLGAIVESEQSSETHRERLNRFAVGQLFATVISSFDIKQTMPEPICYLTVLEALGLPADQVAFVGHDSAQLAGATAVGMPTIAFNYDADAEADVYLGRFEELIDAVGGRPTLAAAG